MNFNKKFVQLHILTPYAASNLNRDDLGRPKTVTFGNTLRFRVSSQSMKRAWRTSSVFQQALGNNMGIRTKAMGLYVYKALIEGNTVQDMLSGQQEAQGGLVTLKESQAAKIARAIGGVFGKIKKESKKFDQDNMKEWLEALEIEQMAHFSPQEIDLIAKLTESCRETGKEPGKEELDLLRKDIKAVDIALFGRMLANAANYNMDAAMQVAHAMTVHRVAVEDDFFTAVDDLNREDSGAGHMGISEFGAGLFYIYCCIDRELLLENLQGDKELAEKTLKAVLEAMLTVSPTGKQNSYASRARALYCLAEKGDDQPRSLAAAFMKGIDSNQVDISTEAIQKLDEVRENFDKVYGSVTKASFLNVLSGQGSLEELKAFMVE